MRLRLVKTIGQLLEMMKRQSQLSRYGTAGILLADMAAVCTLVKTWSVWGNNKPEDDAIFRWATMILFVVSVVIVPIIFTYCRRIDADFEADKTLPGKSKRQGAE